MLTPYEPELAEKNEQLFCAAGLNIVNAIHLGLTTDVEMSAVSQEYIHQSVQRLLADPILASEIDSIFIGCSALNVLSNGFVDWVERETGKPVVTSMQALLWNLLRLSGIGDHVEGCGQLLRLSRLPENVPSVRNASDKKRMSTQPDFSDVYPSRLVDKQTKLIDRIDPIIAKDNIHYGPLSSRQMLDFERDGAIVLQKIFGTSEVNVLRQSVVDLREYYEQCKWEELDPTIGHRIIAEKEVGGGVGTKHALKSIWEIHKAPEDAPHLKDAAPMLYALVQDARLVNVARQLLGDEVYIHQSRINFQQGYGEHNPLGGTGFLWHQDFEQWHSEDGMPRMRAVSMAVLLDRNIYVNGALLIIPGTHRHLIQTEAYTAEGLTEEQARLRLKTGPMLGDHLFPDLANKYGIRYCTGEPGDVVVFDCATLHGSHTNISPWPRQNIFLVYNAVSNTLNPNGPYDKTFPLRPEYISTRDEKYMGIPITGRVAR